MLLLRFYSFSTPYTENLIMSQSVLLYQSFVGVDLHKTTVTLVAVDLNGTEIARLTLNTKCREKIKAWLATLPRPLHLAVEAVGFVEWFIECFRPCVDRIDIADATELSNRRGKRRKNDYRDALDVAQRLARGECPCGYIADDELMQLRKLGRHWRQLSSVLARVKQFMKSVLLAANLRGPKFDGASVQRWLIAHGRLLKPAQRQAFANFARIVQLIELQREPLRYAIIMASRSERFASMTKLLQSVPGIGEIWSCIIAAEIGPFDRFPNADALEFWAGMTADVKESAGRTQPGSITKAGSRTLRWALCNAALTLCHSDAGQEAIRQRLIRKTGGIKGKANTAMGRRLLRLLYAMVRDNKPYCAGPSRHRNAAANKARAAKRTRILARAQKTGKEAA
jgi:transposase